LAFQLEHLFNCFLLPLLFLRLVNAFCSTLFIFRNKQLIFIRISGYLFCSSISCLFSYNHFRSCIRHVGRKFGGNDGQVQPINKCQNVIKTTHSINRNLVKNKKKHFYNKHTEMLMQLIINKKPISVPFTFTNFAFFCITKSVRFVSKKKQLNTRRDI